MKSELRTAKRWLKCTSTLSSWATHSLLLSPPELSPAACRRKLFLFLPWRQAQEGRAQTLLGVSQHPSPCPSAYKMCMTPWWGGDLLRSTFADSLSLIVLSGKRAGFATSQQAAIWVAQIPSKLSHMLTQESVPRRSAHSCYSLVQGVCGGQFPYQKLSFLVRFLMGSTCDSKSQWSNLFSFSFPSTDVDCVELEMYLGRPGTDPDSPGLDAAWARVRKLLQK